jgi:hypothetical protein
MADVLHQVPPGIRQIYVMSAGSLTMNPEYMRPFLGVSAEIIIVARIDWNYWTCLGLSDSVALDHSIADGTVSLTVTLPPCENFAFYTARFDDNITDGRLYRNRISYELPEARLVKKTPWDSRFYLGRRMTVHVRPSGPARFVIDPGGPNRIAWFDTP